MSLLNLINEVDTEHLDKETKDKHLNRKDALTKMSSYSKKLAVAALPLGVLNVLTKPAQAQDNEQVIESLNFALTLEFLEYRYYEMGLESGVIAGDDQNIFEQIEKHEEAHTVVLQDTIESLGGTPTEEPTFDFTAGGNFQPFEDYPTFLTLSQAFEDTGVRAYKGQAGNVMNSNEVLTAALQIHSVEGRHASQVRRMRELKGWITGGPENQNVPSAAEAIYEGEDNTTQAGAEVTDIADVSEDAITEAWDEPLGMEEVNNIASLFIESS